MKIPERICVKIFMITVILTVISAVFLPDTVIVQRSARANTVWMVPKLCGISAAVIFNIVGAAGILISKKPAPEKYKTLFLSIFGMCLFLYMLVVNCLF